MRSRDDLVTPTQPRRLNIYHQAGIVYVLYCVCSADLRKTPFLVPWRSLLDATMTRNIHSINEHGTDPGHVCCLALKRIST